jgi:pyrroloquinoline quinone (PQQ) biosynthesis protein C
MSQLPYGPEDLASPPLAGAAFLELLAENYSRKLCTPPEFFAALYEGNLNREQLQTWIKDQYFYWDNLYFSTAGIYIKTNDHQVRPKLLRRLVWIEGKSIVRDVRPDWRTPAYEELWVRLGGFFGLTRDEIEEWQPYTRTFFSISTLCLYSRGWEWTWLDGIANLYASDLYYRDVLTKAKDALQEKYGVPEENLAFFDNLLTDTADNIAWEEEALGYWACTTERQLTAARAFRERLDIEGQCLVGVTQALAGSTPFQTPRGSQIPDLLHNEIVPVQVE